MIGLSREYSCAFGRPVIRAVDPAIFRYRYFTHCMACGFCADACCSYGVDIDVENVKRLKAMGPDFERFVGVPRAQWFTDEYDEDREFPGGASMRTNAIDGACIFLNRGRRGCKIHAYCLENGIDYHLLKPLVSVLFPITFEEGALVPSDEIHTNELVCAGEGPSLYDGVRGELVHYFGAEFVGELDAIRAGLIAAGTVESVPDANVARARR